MLTMQATTSRMTQQFSSTFRQTAIFVVPAAAAKNSSARKTWKKPGIPSTRILIIPYCQIHIGLPYFQRWFITHIDHRTGIMELAGVYCALQ